MTTVREPQRFKWKAGVDGAWFFGVCMPCFEDEWCVYTGASKVYFSTDPWEVLGCVLVDIVELQWIDNDNRWLPYDQSQK